VSRLDKSSCGVLLCYVTDRRGLYGIESTEQRATLLRKIAAASAASVDWIQIREKDLPGKDCASLTLEALKRTAKPATNTVALARILVNDRLDVALSQKVDGVHLGENSLPLAEVRRLVDAREGTPDFLVGVS
jgi:thiamine-phosphate pyrophosphorylase